jgi:hypothetical protein
MFNTKAGQQEISNGVATAKNRVRKVLDAIGGSRGLPTLSQSCIWNVVEAGLTLEDWTRKIGDGGGQMNADKASGSRRPVLMTASSQRPARRTRRPLLVNLPPWEAWGTADLGKTAPVTDSAIMHTSESERIEGEWARRCLLRAPSSGCFW